MADLAGADPPSSTSLLSHFLLEGGADDPWGWWMVMLVEGKTFFLDFELTAHNGGNDDIDGCQKV